MSRSVQLRLRVEAPGGVIYTYDRTRVTFFGDQSSELSFESGDVSVSQVTAAIAGTFLGVESPLLLPDDGQSGYRAIIERSDDGGATWQIVSDGIAYREAIRFRSRPSLFEVSIENAALEIMWQRLEGVRLRELTGAALSVAMAGRIQPDSFHEREQGILFAGPVDGPTERLDLSPTNGNWWRIDAVARACLQAAVDTTYTGPDMAYRYAVDYLDGAEQQTIIREAVLYIHNHKTNIGAFPLRHLPDWSGREFMEAAVALCGWRLRAEFTSFPARKIDVRVVPDTFSPPRRNVPDLSALRLAGGYSITVENAVYGPEIDESPTPDAGETTLLSGPVGEGGFDRWPANVGPGVDEPYHASPPPAYAVYAPETWVVDEADQDTRTGRITDPRRGKGEAMRFRLPLTASTVELGFQVHHHTPEPGYGEIVYYALPLTRAAEDILYIASFVQAAPGLRMVLGRKPDFPAPAQERPINEAWAAAAARSRELSGPRFVVSGVYDDRGIDLQPGFDYIEEAGERWLVQRISRSLRGGIATITGVRPFRTTPRSIARPASIGPPLAVIGRLSQNTSNEAPMSGLRFVRIHWDPPKTELGLAWDYRIERSLDAGSTWVFEARTRACAYFDVLAEGEAGDRHYRVRASDHAGIHHSDYVEVIVKT